LAFQNGSRIYVTMSARGSTPQFLHVSEFGKICARFPAKAREIVTGSINAVEQGNFVTIESTAEGASGHFYEFCREAERAAQMRKKLSPLEFKYFFFPWWKEPTYRAPNAVVVPQELQDYFKTLETREGITLDEQQRDGSETAIRCHLCQRECGPFLRHDFVRPPQRDHADPPDKERMIGHR